METLGIENEKQIRYSKAIIFFTKELQIFGDFFVNLQILL